MKFNGDSKENLHRYGGVSLAAKGVVIRVVDG